VLIKKGANGYVAQQGMVDETISVYGKNKGGGSVFESEQKKTEKRMALIKTSGGVLG